MSAAIHTDMNDMLPDAPVSRLEARVAAANAAGRPALVPFLTAGFPTLDRFWEEMDGLDRGGADVIEIGVPFSDPVADGPVVEAASLRALENGVTLRWILDGLKARAGRYDAELVLMGYYNPFLQYGLENLAVDAAAAGVAGFIVPDLPLEEDGEMRALLAARGIDLIALVGPNTSEERMAEYAAVASGYVYVVSVLGITGVREGLPPEVPQTLARARKAFRLPLALGFGIKEPKQLEGFPDRPDAVVFGSALLRHIDAGNSAESFLAAWK